MLPKRARHAEWRRTSYPRTHPIYFNGKEDARTHRAGAHPAFCLLSANAHTIEHKNANCWCLFMSIKRSIYVSNEIRFLVAEESYLLRRLPLQRGFHWQKIRIEMMMKMSLFIFYQSRWWEVWSKWRMDIHAGSPNKLKSLLVAGKFHSWTQLKNSSISI